MPLTVTIEPETGTASLHPSLPLPVDQDLRFSLQDTRSRLYLTPSGWSPTRKTLFQARVTEDDTTLHLDQAVTSQLTSGTPLLLEEIYVNYREAFVWAAPEPSPLPAAPDPEPPVTGAEPDHIEVASVEAVTEAAPEATFNPAPADRAAEQLVHRRHPVSPLLLAGAGAIVGALLSAVVLTALPASTEPESAPAPPSQPAAVAQASPVASVPSSATSLDEVNALKNKIAALERAAIERNLDLRASRQARDRLSEALVKAQQELATAQKDSAPAELLSQIEQQKATIQRLQQAVSNTSPGGNSAGTSETERLLRDRNTQLTEETAEQRARIASLEDELEKATEALIILKEDASATIEPSGPSGTWLGVAVSRSGSVEVAINQSSSQAAFQAAEALCRENGGQGCRALESYAGGCVAVARQRGARILPGNFWYDNGASPNGASARAERQCVVANDGDWACDTAFVKCSQ